MAAEDKILNQWNLIVFTHEHPTDHDTPYFSKATCLKHWRFRTDSGITADLDLLIF